VKAALLFSCAGAGLLSMVVPTLAYRWLFAAAALARGRYAGGAEAANHRFLVIIPAHDEEVAIAGSVAAVRATDYPGELLEVVVTADNCADQTARIAREQGARVLERNRPDDPGKGQAIAWTLEQVSPYAADAVVFLDADCRVSGNFFRALSGALTSGADIIQTHNAPSNPDASALTRLMAITSIMKNLLFYQGKQALGLSAHLMGTGMAFRSSVIRRYGWSSRSVGEDLEQSLSLIRAGERIHYIGHAQVFAEEAVHLAQGYGQRRRWAAGRLGLARGAWDAIRLGLRDRRLILIDAGVELLMPTYSMSLNLTLLALLLGVLSGPGSNVLAISLGALLGQCLEGMAALWVMRPSWRFVLSLGFAPLFLIWKLAIDLMTLVGRRPRRWVRTARSGPRPESTSDR